MKNRALAKHIEALNSNGNSDLDIITDLEHWADYNVYTPAELNRYQHEQDYIYLFNEVNGFKPRKDLDLYTDIMLIDAVDELYNQLDLELEEIDEWDGDFPDLEYDLEKADYFDTGIYY